MRGWENQESTKIGGFSREGVVMEKKMMKVGKVGGREKMHHSVHIHNILKINVRISNQKRKEKKLETWIVSLFREHTIPSITKKCILKYKALSVDSVPKEI